MHAPADLDLVRQLGEGGGGLVWLARVVRGDGAIPAPPGTLVALKRPHADAELREVAADAFAREIEVTSRVQHPHLTELLASGLDDHGPWVATRFVDGPTLRESLEAGAPLPEPLLRSLGSDLGDALHALHAAGWLHGDVSPENVRLDAQGRAVLLDLGLAHPIGEAGKDGGSIAYLSPEQLRGDAARPASDVFALGVLLYEMATGSHPFGAERETDPSALFERLSQARVPPASQEAPRLTPLFDGLVDAALRRDADLRPTAAELSTTLSEGETSAWWRRWIQSRLAGGESIGDDLFESERTPFVGRARPLTELTDIYRSVTDRGRGAVRVLRGPEDVGKRRLVTELTARLRAGSDPCTFLHARCSQRSEARPFGTAIELLERWLQLGPNPQLADADRSLLARFLAPRDAVVLERALDPTSVEELGGSFAQSLARWVAALSTERPVVVWIDDLNRARGSTLDAIRRLVEQALEAPTLVLLGVDEDRVAAEPDVLRRVLERATTTGEGGELRLGRLTQADVEQLVARAFEAGAPRRTLARELWARSRGNPGLIDELLRGLESRGQVERDDRGLLRLLIPIQSLPFPTSLAESAQARYRELEPELRRWLERLAVAGGRMEPTFLARAFPPTELSEIEGVLVDLARSGWLESRGDRYRFSRPNLREALYRATGQERRARLHRMVARAFASSAAEHLEDAYQQAFHLRSADESAALLDLVAAVLPRLSGRVGPRRVLRLTRWGLEALDSTERGPGDDRGDLERELLERALGAAQQLGDRRTQRARLDRLAELPPGLNETRDLAVTYQLHGEYALAIGDYGLARGMLRGATEFGERAGRADLVGKSLRERATIEAEFNDLSGARDLAARALDRCSRPTDRAAALLVSARIELLADRIERALGDVAEALNELRRAQLRAPSVRSDAFLIRARIWRCAGRNQRALAAARHALELARESEDRVAEVELTARLGWLSLDADRLDEAEAWLRDARIGSDEVEDQRARVLSDLWLGILMWERSTPGARSRLGSALELAGEIGYHRAEAVGRAVRARIAARDGDPERGLEDAERALALVDSHGAELADRIVVVGSATLVRRLAGRLEEPGGDRAALVERIAEALGRISEPGLRDDFARYTRRLLSASESLDATVYPRS